MRRRSRGQHGLYGILARGTAPTEVCDHHVQVTVCKDSGALATEFCPSSSRVTRVYRLITDEITGSTDDTPYVLPDSLRNSSCYIHTSYQPPVPRPRRPSLPKARPLLSVRSPRRPVKVAASRRQAPAPQRPRRRRALPPLKERTRRKQHPSGNLRNPGALRIIHV